MGPADVRTGVLYPGQIETKRFPVVGERSPVLPSQWNLEVKGLVVEPFSLDLQKFLGRATRELRADIHCVTSWSRFDVVWTGISLRELVGDAEISPQAHHVRFGAYSVRDHDTSLPVDIALEDCWLVHSLNGEPLSTEHGGPVRTVVPSRYFYKSLKWVKDIEFLALDSLGFWERESAYHNNGDPISGRERFTTGSLRPQQLDRFMQAKSYAKYRKKVLLGLDLRQWKPATADLRGLALKNCDLRGVDLSNCDLRESNLSLSNLGFANLSNADLRGSDLEGANFCDADLRGADISFSALTATRFTSEDGQAQVEGLTWESCFGLVESQLEFLQS